MNNNANTGAPVADANGRYAFTDPGFQSQADAVSGFYNKYQSGEGAHSNPLVNQTRLTQNAARTLGVNNFANQGAQDIEAYKALNENWSRLTPEQRQAQKGEYNTGARAALGYGTNRGVR